MSNPRHLVFTRGLSPDGYGIAFEGDDTAEFYVHDLLPGESAWVEIEHTSTHAQRHWARVVERAGEFYKHRVSPPCPVFSQCGGCAWQHLDAEGQGKQKRQRVVDALEAKLGPLPSIAPPSATHQDGYRNKGKYVVAQDGETMVLGAYKPRSHDVVSTIGCRVVEPAIDKVARHIARAGTAHGTPVYEEGRPDSTGLRYAVLRSNREGEVLALLVCTTDTPGEATDRLAHDLMARPEVAGVLRCNNDSRAGVILTDSIEHIAGNATIPESAAGIPIALGAAEFWQLNREQAATAIQELADALDLESGAKVVDLYCGVGAISFALAKHGYRVVGVENNSQAIETARGAAKASGLSQQMEFHCADATALASEILANADAVVVDPPRKGLGEAGIRQLLEALPKSIAYLSCGPESLASDLAAFTAAGYTLETVRLYDFMPGTSQVETLAILRRAKQAAH